MVSNAIPQPEDEVFIRATPDAGKLSFSVSSLGLKALCGASGSRASRICPTGSLFSWWPQHQTASGVRTCLSPGQDPTPLRPRVPDDLECLTGKQIARDRIVGQYNVRLVEERRSEFNPSGLLVAEYSEKQMVGERDNRLEQKSQLDK